MPKQINDDDDRIINRKANQYVRHIDDNNNASKVNADRQYQSENAISPIEYLWIGQDNFYPNSNIINTNNLHHF